MSDLGKTGLFVASYTITTPGVGGPTFNVHLTVYTPGETVGGIGQVTETTNPPLDVATKLDGSFTYMTVMPDVTHVLITATGYPIIHWPPQAGLGPVILPNVQLQMVLEGDWKSGTANYKYIDNNNQWQSVSKAAVTLVSSPTL